MNTPTSTGAARAWTPQMLTEWQNTLTLITSRLRRVGDEQDAEDVHQNTWLAAHQSLDHYNPATGEFGPWIRGIAAMQVRLHAREKYSRASRQERFSHEAHIGISSTLALIEEDIAEGIIEEAGQYTRLQHVLSILASVIETQEHLTRTLNIILAFDGHISAASKALQVPARTLRENQTNTVRLAQVINRALDAHEARGGHHVPVTVEDLLECLPGHQHNAPAAFGALVSMIASGSAVDVEAMMSLADGLGLSEHSSKVYCAQMLKLLAVAKEVIEVGLELAVVETT